MDIDLPRLRALSDLAPFDSHHIILHRMHACTLLPLCPAPCSASNLLPAHPRLDVHVQVSNTHDWHGTRKLARANEQQKLQQQQMAKQRQQQQKQAKKRQQQQNGGETRVSTRALNPSGARSADDATRRVLLPFSHRPFSDTRVSQPFSGPSLLCSRAGSFELVGRTAVAERDGGEACGERGQVQT